MIDRPAAHAGANRFIPVDPWYDNISTVRLPVATSDTATLIEIGLASLRRISCEGYRYKKGGVMLTDLVPTDQVKGHLFVGSDTEKQGRINATLDEFNRRFEKCTLRLAAVGIHHRWGMRRAHGSPSYTTLWSDLPRAKA